MYTHPYMYIYIYIHLLCWKISRWKNHHFQSQKFWDTSVKPVSQGPRNSVKPWDFGPFQATTSAPLDQRCPPVKNGQQECYNSTHGLVSTNQCVYYIYIYMMYFYVRQTEAKSRNSRNLKKTKKCQKTIIKQRES